MWPVSGINAADLDDPKPGTVIAAAFDSGKSEFRVELS
jgi:hypothetical protein